MEKLFNYLKSSIGRKQVVATSGLLLIVYVILHLAGNLLLLLGPEAFNSYAKKMTGLRPGLYIIEFGLLLVFVIHIWVTATLVLENVRARGKGYAVQRSVGHRSLATKLMPYTGTALLLFVIWHIMDFTLIDHHGPRSVLADGQSYGLYGVVYNSFADPTHSVLYILAMLALGLHLSHGIQSFVQTFGFNQFSPKSLRVMSVIAGYLIAVGFSTIPIYVLIDSGAFK